jgi:uncharacterized protein YecT (DUF1311 family)
MASAKSWWRTLVRVSLPPSFLLLLLPGFSRAQCEDKKTTVDTIDCLTTEFKKAGVELNRLYQVKIKKLSQADAARLRKAQRAWIGYRDAHCEAEAALYEGGSIAPVIQGSCRLKLTQLRTKEIEAAYQDH